MRAKRSRPVHPLYHRAGRTRRLCAALLTIGCIAGAQAQPAPATPPPPPAQRPDDSIAAIASQLDRTPDTVAATVDGTPITLGMVADRLRELPPNMKTIPGPRLFQIALRDVITRRAAVIKAKALGLNKDPVIQRHMTEAADQVLITALLDREAPKTLTKAQISQRYKTEVAAQPGPVAVQLRIIITRTEAAAQQVLGLIQNGMDFAAAARKFSQDTSKANGGEVGYVRRDQLSPEIGAVAFSLAPGQTTAYPVPSGGLWFVLRCEARRMDSPPTLQQATPRLRQELLPQAAVGVLEKARAAVKVQEFGATGQPDASDN